MNAIALALGLVSLLPRSAPPRQGASAAPARVVALNDPPRSDDGPSDDGPSDEDSSRNDDDKEAMNRALHPGSVPVFSKPSTEVLELIPAPPLTVDEALSRRGPIASLDARRKMMPGDKQSGPAAADLRKWQDSVTARSMEAQQKMNLTMTRDQANALGALSQRQKAFAARQSQLLVGLASTMHRLADDLHKATFAIANEFAQPLENACGAGHPVDRCPAVRAQLAARNKAAGQAYLSKAAPAIASYRAEVKKELLEDRGPLSALKGAPRPYPIMLQGTVQSIEGAELLLLGELVAVNGELIEEVGKL